MVRCVVNLGRILFASDFSDDANYALEYAMELARRFAAEILVLHVDQPLAPVLTGGFGAGDVQLEAMNRLAEEHRMWALDELDRTVSRLREGGFKARTLLRVGVPFLEIINTALSESADLIVVGTHGRTGLAHVMLGSVAERVVRKSPCPVLTVRHPERKFKHPLDQ